MPASELMPHRQLSLDSWARPGALTQPGSTLRLLVLPGQAASITADYIRPRPRARPRGHGELLKLCLITADYIRPRPMARPRGHGELLKLLRPGQAANDSDSDSVVVTASAPGHGPGRRNQR